MPYAESMWLSFAEGLIAPFIELACGTLFLVVYEMPQAMHAALPPSNAYSSTWLHVQFLGRVIAMLGVLDLLRNITLGIASSLPSAEISAESTLAALHSCSLGITCLVPGSIAKCSVSAYAEV